MLQPVGRVQEHQVKSASPFLKRTQCSCRIIAVHLGLLIHLYCLQVRAYRLNALLLHIHEHRMFHPSAQRFNAQTSGTGK
ncbi:hypothetical protein D3C75_1008110 [compost metagenome]